MADKKLDVRVYPLDNAKGATKAFASIAFDDKVAIRGIRVVEDSKGLFVSMPQSQDKKTNAWHDIAYPANGDLRKDVIKAVLGEYHEQAALPTAERGYGKPEKGTAELDVSGIKLDITVYPLPDPQGNTQAFAKLSVDDLVTIRGIRVVEGEKGLFVAMPQEQDKYLNYHDIAFPINADLRTEISARILEAFDSAEKSVERKPTLTDKLTTGIRKAAEHSTPANLAAKTRTPGVLE